MHPDLLAFERKIFCSFKKETEPSPKWNVNFPSRREDIAYKREEWRELSDSRRVNNDFQKFGLWSWAKKVSEEDGFWLRARIGIHRHIFGAIKSNVHVKQPLSNWISLARLHVPWPLFRGNRYLPARDGAERDSMKVGLHCKFRDLKYYQRTTQLRKESEED